MKIRNKKSVVIAGSIFFGILLGWIFFGGSNQSAEKQNDHSVSENSEETIWTCSMHPQIRQNEPGDCPICGMELIPVEKGMEQQNPQVVHLSEYAKKLGNVQTMTVGTKSATNEIRLNGKVAIDERQSYSQSTHIPGRIERLYVNFTGEKVNSGQALAKIYSPELVTAQEELLQAYAIRESNPRLFEAAKEKLSNWKIGQNQITRILERGKPSEQFTISADVSGIVTKKMVELGDYVQRGTPIYEIANLNQVWVLFDVYENEMSWIEEGDKIKFTVASLPGETFEGKVEFIDPLVNPQTRVSTARVVVNNEKGRLKPGMFVTGTVKIPLGESVNNKLTVPKSAVLWTGKRSVVYVEAEDGSGYLLREVVLGPSLGDSYVIAKGLNPGEKVVINGTFTVDAAAQLAGKPSMMSPEGGGGAPSTPGMDMPVREVQQVETAAFVEGEVADLREQIPATFKTQLNEVVDAYLELKEGLIEGDEDETQRYSSALLAALEELDESALSGEAKAFWDEKRSFLFEHAKLCKDADTMAGKRENFIYLSQPLIKIVETFGTNQTLYVDYCPMVKAYWLSGVEEIRNPFMPEMRSCGEVRDTLNAK